MAKKTPILKKTITLANNIMLQHIIPVTRYYGSKRKLLPAIWGEIEKREIPFESVLDIFGGSATFSYYAKLKGKKLIYNDLFRFNYLIAKAIIGNKTLSLSLDETLQLLKENPDINYKHIIQENFNDIYYPDDENRVIDIVIQNIQHLADEEKQASAYYILFQSCMIKRPYNLFHRKNLNLRTNYNGGNFGNKTTWERSFEELFIRFHKELSECTFDNGFDNKILNSSALKCDANADLVYIDPPYFHKDNHLTYHSKYHFLEGLAHYDQILSNINFETKNKEITINKTREFENKATFLFELDQLLNKHSDSVILLSYRSNGIPSIIEIEELLRRHRSNVEVITLGKYNYALTRNNKETEEYLFIGK
ncbi:DNA adenine methylase [Sphingobacterium haloxyli]|uniref:site-specific DNA-methyltransferase (adenine-specific) n=1 Tax=Sphingobacterium haloxyli TaxID=2100533 RepID=A0A2S9J5H3_9SPHI|nr:DNA adenine methylase [Sphingobacterium haloxyli]PRD48025.1 DNA methyltransferase [Sphingobacterium haloxyli]